MTADCMVTVSSRGLRRHLGDAAKGQKGKPRPDGKGGYFITLPHGVLDRLKAMRGPGENYTDVILRVARRAKILRRSVDEKMLKVRPTLDNGSRAFLKGALYPFQERSSDLSVDILLQGKFVRHIPKLGMSFENLVDLLSEARDLVAQVLCH